MSVIDCREIRRSTLSLQFVKRRVFPYFPFVAVPSILGVLLVAAWLLFQKPLPLLPLSASIPRTVSIPRAVSVSVSVSDDPGYRKAKAQFARHDYAGAIAAIDALLAEPTRTEADRVFLRRQRDICRSTGRGTVKAPSPAITGAPASPSVPATVVSTADCGPRALLLVCREVNLPGTLPTLPALSKMAGVTAPKGASLEGMAKAATLVGFAPEAVQMDRDALANLSTPALAWVDGNHYLAVFKVQRSLLGVAHDTVIVQDPNKERKETLLLTTLLSRSGGVFLTLTTKPTKRSAG